VNLARRLIAPLVLRRLKKEVASQLVGKTRKREGVDMTQGQR
jgi:SNF2 family DNA or RNA helicase